MNKDVAAGSPYPAVVRNIRLIAYVMQSAGVLSHQSEIDAEKLAAGFLFYFDRLNRQAAAAPDKKDG